MRTISLLAVALALAAGCSRSPAPAPPDAGGSDAAVVCATCNVSFEAERVVEARPPGTPQREPSVDVDSHGTVWLAYIDYPDPAANKPHVRATKSTDGGKTFEASVDVCGDCGDPVVAIDSRDRVYLATIDRGGKRSARLRRLDAAADNPGVATTFSNATDSYPDREWMALGPNDEVYVTWNAGIADSALYFARSTDHGKSFEPSVVVAKPAAGELLVYGAIAVGPSGQISIAYPSGTPNATADDVTATGVFFTRSTDGGGKFSAPVAVPAAPEQPVPGTLGNAAFKALFIDFPAIAAAPNGDVFVTWTGQRAGAPDAIDVLTSRTTDGLTFSTPVAANDGPTTTRTMPCSTIGGDGALHVSWLDARDYPGGRNAPWTVFWARSTDGARRFEPSVRLSSQRLFGDPGPSVGLQYAIGEFNTLRGRGDSVYAAWSGAVSADVDLFLAVGHLAR